MATAVDTISEQIVKLSREAQYELLQRLPMLLNLSEEDLDWLRLAEEEYARQRQRFADFPLKRLSRAKQRRMDELADRHTEGELSAEEEQEYFALVDEAQQLTIENARRLAQRFRPELFDERGEERKEPRRRRQKGRRKKT